MADVTGPISTLPGSRHSVPAGMACDEHPDRPAIARIQGETDSFGSEMLDLCAECAAEISKAASAPRRGYCHWCHGEADDVRQHRDFEEGSCGPVYDVCGDCRRRESESLARDATDRDDYYD